MTHAELVERAVRWLLGNRRCAFAVAEPRTAASEFPDAIGWIWDSGQSILVECKANLADYRHDRQKLSRRGDGGPGNYRWYMAPHGVLRDQELPRGWGLAEVYATMVRIRKHAACREAPSIVAQDRKVLVTVARNYQRHYGDMPLWKDSQ